MVKAILFDMDGTLVDSELHYMTGTKKWMRDFGYTGPDEEIYKIIGTSMDETTSILRKLLDNRYDFDYLKEFNDNFFLNEFILDYGLALFPKVKDYLHKFKEDGYLLALCTQSDRPYINKCIKDAGLQGIFDYIVSGEEMEHGKPAPDIYLAALKDLNIKAEEAIVYEDSYQGIKSGKSAGIYTVARRDERFGVNQSEADKLVNGIDELYNLIRGLDGR